MDDIDNLIHNEISEWKNKNQTAFTLSLETSWLFQIVDTKNTDELVESYEHSLVQLIPFYKPYTKMFKI